MFSDMNRYGRSGEQIEVLNRISLLSDDNSKREKQLLVFRPLMSPSLDIFCRFATLKKRDI
jgi:hypothetical protein